jgi:hypothetical protein
MIYFPLRRTMLSARSADPVRGYSAFLEGYHGARKKA